MTNLLDASTRSATFARLDALDPDSDRRWGRMNVGGMLCHLTDSFLACMGERETGDRTSIVSKTVMRFIAVSTPLPWPKGLPTLPEGDQEKQGTPPGLFEADRARLREVTERFLDELDGARYFHPLCGAGGRGGTWTTTSGNSESKGRHGYRSMAIMSQRSELVLLEMFHRGPQGARSSHRIRSILTA